MKIFVAILLIAAVPAYAQAKDRGAAKLSKGDAQKVATIIRSDKTKTQTYCEINKVSDQMNQAYGKNDRKMLDDLSQKIERLEKVLGPEYIALWMDFRNAGRKMKSALSRLCCNSQHSTGCVRNRFSKTRSRQAAPRVLKGGFR